jgi:hypothetical protein
MNYICASGGVGGWQNSSDTDVGQVAIHTTLLGNVADGRYYVHLSGVNMYWERDFLVEVTGGVVSFNQDAVVFAETPWWFWGNPFGSIRIAPGQPNISGGANEGFIGVEGGHYDCCAYGCTPRLHPGAGSFYRNSSAPHSDAGAEYQIL